MLIEVEGVTAPAVTHAFVVGVSHYPFLDGPQMTRPGEQLGHGQPQQRGAVGLRGRGLAARTSTAAPRRRSRTSGCCCRRSTGEALHPDVVARHGRPARARDARDGRKDEFTAFKDACAENTANRAFVFLAGHGIQLSSRGAILLLEDFATAPRTATCCSAPWT